MVNLRILLGFAFLPAGLKKVLNQPFTDPGNAGPFHDFLHAFHSTGFFYQFVGAVQIGIAVLLMTQRFAGLGAMLALPVFTTILVFCWSTKVYFTAVMVTLMFFGTLLLVSWEFPKWRRLVEPDAPDLARDAPVDQSLWRWCGIAILLLYLGVCAYSGGIYRPRGVDLGNPAFYVFPFIALFPVVTYLVERTRRKDSAAAAEVKDTG